MDFIALFTLYLPAQINVRAQFEKMQVDVELRREKQKGSNGYPEF